MTFKTRCPHCNCKLEMEDQWLGEECQCPRCQKTFVISSRPETPNPRPLPKIVPVEEPAPTPAVTPAVAPTVAPAVTPTVAPPPFKAPSITAPSAAAPSRPAPAPSATAPSRPVPPPPKVSFRPAHAADRTPPPQQEQQQGKRLICPKCKKSYVVNQAGLYPCSCGTSLEYLDDGSINVHMILPKHGIGFYILIGVLSFLMLVTILIIMCTMIAAAIAGR